MGRMGRFRRPDWGSREVPAPCCLVVGLAAGRGPVEFFQRLLQFFVDRVLSKPVLSAHVVGSLSPSSSTGCREREDLGAAAGSEEGPKRSWGGSRAPRPSREQQLRVKRKERGRGREKDATKGRVA